MGLFYFAGYQLPVYLPGIFSGLPALWQALSLYAAIATSVFNYEKCAVYFLR